MLRPMLYRCGEQPADVTKEQVADLGLNFREGVLGVPVLVSKGKRGPDLLYGRFSFPRKP